jgi:hypothetical protein
MGCEAFDDHPLSPVPALIESVATGAGAIFVHGDARTCGSARASMIETSTRRSTAPLASRRAIYRQ